MLSPPEQPPGPVLLFADTTFGKNNGAGLTIRAARVRWLLNKCSFRQTSTGCTRASSTAIGASAHTLHCVVKVEASDKSLLRNCRRENEDPGPKQTNNK